MITKPYFVILDHPKGLPCPLMENDANIMMFETELVAKEAGFNSSLADALGFEIFELGGGIWYSMGDRNVQY